MLCKLVTDIRIIAFKKKVLPYKGSNELDGNVVIGLRVLKVPARGGGIRE